MNRVFISYKRVDKNKVFGIRDLIESQIGKGECWIDLDGIESDAQFEHVIMRAIERCDVFLFMYSKKHTLIKNFDDDDWTFRELGFARAIGKKIVFINIDGSPLSNIFLFKFCTKQQVDGRSQLALNKLVTDMRKWLDIPDPVMYTPEALYEKGKRYYSGKGVEQNYSEAVKWFYKAAERGHAIAQNNLGVMYYKGDGVAQDYVESVKWYRKSAEQGYADAQRNLGLIYYKGDGVAQDYKEAEKWFYKAASQENAKAQYTLGIMNEFGIGVARNGERAIYWYRKAANNGYIHAYGALERLKNMDL